MQILQWDTWGLQFLGNCHLIDLAMSVNAIFKELPERLGALYSIRLSFGSSPFATSYPRKRVLRAIASNAYLRGKFSKFIPVYLSIRDQSHTSSYAWCDQVVSDSVNGVSFVWETVDFDIRLFDNIYNIGARLAAVVPTLLAWTVQLITISGLVCTLDAEAMFKPIKALVHYYSLLRTVSTRCGSEQCVYSKVSNYHARFKCSLRARTTYNKNKTIIHQTIQINTYFHENQTIGNGI